MPLRTLVFGPAYLDRVVRVDGPLVDPESSPPLDQSVEGAWEFGQGLSIVDSEGLMLEIGLPEGWGGPTGRATLSGKLGVHRSVLAVSSHDDLGGMGAGFASAFGGTLVSVIGPADDPISLAVARLLRENGIDHRPARVDHPADWTLLISSGAYGDKLPVGFRGAQRASSLNDLPVGACDLLVVAGLPNPIAAEILKTAQANTRFFAPTIRNVTDRRFPISRFSEFVDILSCNRREWELIDDREQLAWQLPVLAITDGPAGSLLRFTRPDGDAGRLVLPAFPRDLPPLDTNRAGEAFAATLVEALIASGCSGGVIDPDHAREAAVRASAAAALVLDRTTFGFPDPSEIDRALAAGRVGGVGPRRDNPVSAAP